MISKIVYGFIGLITLINICLTVFGCGQVRSENTPAVRLISDQNFPGYICFAIYNEAGSVVGGNCLKEN